LKLRSKKILKISLITMASLLAAYVILSALGAREAMRIPRLPLIHRASEFGLPSQDVSFPTRSDGLTLKGWFLPGTNRQVIIFVHGGFQNRIDDVVDTVALTRALVGKGYNILLFDLRGRGESEGKGINLSNIDQDIGGASDYLKTRGFATKDIAILSFCSGASMSAIYAGRNEVGALILDGCFIDAGTMVVRQGQAIKIPSWLTRSFIPGGIAMTRLLYGFHRIDPIDVIPDIKAPVFFIREQLDEFTTMKETQRMFSKSSNPASQFWEVPGAEHSRGFIVHPDEYVEKIDDFLTKLR
jgi:uncharacterized protein